MYRSLQNMDLNLLIALDVLLEEGHVSRAANKLSLSQSATSRVLAKLRDMFDDPLLVRTSEGMIMTERAKHLKPLVKDNLDCLEKLFIGETFNPKTTTKHFCLRATSYVAQAYLPEVIKRISKEAPNSTISIGNLSAQDFSGADEKEVDLIICGDGFNIPQNYKSRMLGIDKMVCIMSQQHPLAKKELTLENYVNYSHCQMSLGVGNIAASVDSFLAKLEKNRHVRLKLPHVMACLEMVGKSEYLHTNAANLAKKFLSTFNLTMKKLPFEFPDLAYAMYWHPVHQQNPAHVWLRSCCHEEIKRLFDKST
ncbi:MAG: LysR family transcriptional regulator [Colwellia sp.]|nr:LysR family transcriptional regulator [Colwellia sp.]